MDIKIRKAFRSSRVIGMPVKTPDHHKLGHVEEIVVDLERGSIAYAVLSFGGYFGFGDKFFAVPWEEFSLMHDEGGKYFVLDTTAERLKQLPGFKKDEWPDVANSDWDAIVDQHYQQSQGTERQ